MAIKDNGLIEKRNVLNEVRKCEMSLQELRFFSIYLSKINARDVRTRRVRFSLADFQKIMGFGRLNRGQLEDTTNRLLQKIITIPTGKKGGVIKFQLFKECCIDQSEDGSWYIDIEAHDKALPLMFDFKKEYFTYKLWNALRLSSSNQIRMYEILKQYEKIGTRELSITDLRELLGIGEKEYSVWQNFKVRVLDKCQEALLNNTDICFTYERGKTGPGGKWLSVIFHISHNDKYIDQLTLEEFLSEQEDPGEENTQEETRPIVEEDYLTGETAFLSELLDDRYNREEMAIITNLVIQLHPGNDYGQSLKRADYLLEKKRELDYRASKTEIKNRFAYLRRMIEADLEKGK